MISQPRFAEVAPGVRRLTLPLALPSPDHIHCYLLALGEGRWLLVDTGMRATSGLLREALVGTGTENPDVLITHGHVDHWGAATALRDSVLAHPGVRPSLSYAAGEKLPFSGDWPSGLPSRARMEQAFAQYRAMVTGVPRCDPIGDGDCVGSWEVVWTPGHDPGHVCLYRAEDGVLITGDLLLPGYTPNIQPAMDGGGADAVADFLASLRRVADLRIELVLPAHGEPYRDARRRAAELIEHHHERLARLESRLDPAGVEVPALTALLFRELEASEDQMLGSLETVAHLEHLRRAGRAHAQPDGRWFPGPARDSQRP